MSENINIICADGDDDMTRLLCKVANMRPHSNVVYITTSTTSPKNIENNLSERIDGEFIVYEIPPDSSIFKLYGILLGHKNDIDVLIVDTICELQNGVNNTIPAKLQALRDVKKELGCEIWTSIDLWEIEGLK